MVEAPAYSAGTPGTIAASRTAIAQSPDPGAERISEALQGEALTIFDRRDGWAWVQMGHDGYVGYVEANALSRDTAVPTHRIGAPRALIFAAANLKASVIGWLPLGAAAAIDRWSGDYGRLPGGGWTHKRWLREPGEVSPDPVATALQFLGVPYGWGGRTVAGIDCSGLVQVALQASGLGCPRDSDQQAATIGTALAESEPGRRGDIIFFPGHVGLMADAGNLLHANATAMAVTIDPLDQVTETIRKSDSQGRGITARRRLSV